MSGIDYIKKYGLEGLGKFYGLYRGIVSDNDDPDRRARLKLQVPQVYGQGKTFDKWAPSMGMYSGNASGFFAIPGKQEEVWVVFEGGDPRFPVWNYGEWLKNQAPTGATPTNIVLQSKGGHRIEITNQAGQEKLKLSTASGSVVELNQQGISLKKGSLELSTIMQDLLTQIQAITVMVGNSPAGPPVNSAAFASIAVQLNTLLSTSN